MLVYFNAALANGCPITNYQATSYPGDHFVQSLISPISISGLTDGVHYRFYVNATNCAGFGNGTRSNIATPCALIAAWLTNLIRASLYSVETRRPD